jgi:hypothetical protein
MLKNPLQTSKQTRNATTLLSRPPLTKADALSAEFELRFKGFEPREVKEIIDCLSGRKAI